VRLRIISRSTQKALFLKTSPLLPFTLG
jgi:hypothetical protein